MGKLADLVLWKPSLFGAKPEMIIKGGAVAWAQMGDPNASIPTPEPVEMRPMFAGKEGTSAAAGCSVAFVSAASLAEGGPVGGYGLKKRRAFFCCIFYRLFLQLSVSGVSIHTIYYY